MMRRLEPVDLMVAVGLVATIFGGSLFFFAAGGQMVQGESELDARLTLPPTIAGLQWVQPAVGAAIVEQMVVSREMDGVLAAAVRNLNQAMVNEQLFRAGSDEAMSRLVARVRGREQEEEGRIQYVMGKAIVNATQQAVRGGRVNHANEFGPFNQDLVARVELMGLRMRAEFADTWQQVLGKMFVTTTQDMVAREEHNQERMGRNIVEVMQAQHAYQTKLDANQQQLAAAVIASVRTEQNADRFEQLREAERTMGGPAETAPPMEARMWPDVPVGVYVAACLGLMGILLMGLAMPVPRRDRWVTSARLDRRSDTRYRKTA